MNYCNEILHNEFIDEYINCPLCDVKLCSSDAYVQESCCCDPNIYVEGGYQLCFNCGQVHNNIFVKEYVNFHDNKRLLYRKSIYNRKYHIRNVISELAEKDGVIISYDDERKIQLIFKIIDKCMSLLEHKMKRLISTNFIIMKILQMMGKPFDNIEVTRSYNTIKKYEYVWNNIMELRGCDIWKIVLRSNRHIYRIRRN